MPSSMHSWLLDKEPVKIDTELDDKYDELYREHEKKDKEYINLSPETLELLNEIMRSLEDSLDVAATNGEWTSYEHIAFLYESYGAKLAIARG